MIWWLIEALWLGLMGWTIGHALLRKTQASAAWGWIALCLLLPFGGPILYAVFGINRVQTRARKRRQPRPRSGQPLPLAASDARHGARAGHPVLPDALSEVARTGDVVTQLPLLAGNRIELLHDGEQAYPHMIAAIDGAEQWIALTSYIFDSDAAGLQFIEALARAQARGVQVRCLLDGIGELGWPRAGALLQARGVRVARFNPLSLWPPSLHANLRNHRKLLLVDGRCGYTGGMNISLDHLVQHADNRKPTRDLHAALHGPVLAQLLDVFCDDWRYVSGEAWQPQALPALPQTSMLSHPRTAAATPAASEHAICRVITDGPNEDYGQLSMVLLAAIAAARRHIRIVTPYFVPPEEILTALQSAALRGVIVDVILSRNSDHRITHWATKRLFGRLLERGVRVYYQPAPFCHSKLFVVDGDYAQIGSANLDARSLRLNFELMVEVYDAPFAQRLDAHCEALRMKAHRVTAEEVRKRPLALKLRDAACWLFSPYL